MLEIDKFDPKAKRQITQLLDSLIDAEKLRQQLKAGSAVKARKSARPTREAA